MNIALRNKVQSAACTTLSRRGMTVIMVLGVISITLALSYAMLRSQTTSVEIQSNLDRRAAARQAAYAGVSIALRKMHNNGWAGVDVPIDQDVSDHQWFVTSFETGDSTLTPGDEDYGEFPFRVTINTFGYAADPTHPDVRSSYRVKAVVQLVRKQLYAEPATWANVRNFTAYQWSGSALTVEFPVRVEGPVYAQGAFSISTDYPSDLTSRSKYYIDLTSMFYAGKGDFRPFNGPISTPYSKQTAATLSLLQNTMGCTVNNISTSFTAPATFPNVTSYQLYPGGKYYEMPVLQTLYGSAISNISLQADPVNNPLGVFYSNGALQMNDNVNLKGTIIAGGSVEQDIRIVGKNVVLEGRVLPALEGSTVKYQLPVAIVKDDFLLYSAGKTTIRGLVAAWDEFSFQRGDSTASCDMQGRAVCYRLNLNGRAPWDLGLAVWQLEYLNFTTQALLGGTAIAHYPIWLQYRQGLNYQPLLTVKPGSADIVDRWHTWNQPVYVPADGDGGLRWNLIDWTDNPRAAN